jgi:death-on-curing protein
VGIDRKIAALIESVNRNHALVDGNKRLSWVCAVIFAQLNGWTLAAEQEQIDDVVRRVAASRISLDHLTAWVSDHLTAN